MNNRKVADEVASEITENALNIVYCNLATFFSIKRVKIGILGSIWVYSVCLIRLLYICYRENARK